ncbi:MAG: aminomethyl-transferring glycine dehydrogenase subunit GcvPA [Candidatus Actinomarina sp.]|jgi:glycine dehydrogenase subunit 1|nr:aminomethyl-transferring glycine dehydrogenase subunit GcvPA [Candidatus Actinomarina sp.]
MFVPHSNIDLNTIFDELKISSLEELFSHIPKELLIDGGLDFDESLSELEATELFETIASKNASNLVCFAGGGHYDIYLPPTVKSLTMRPEFMTSYTPYQAEISQGILQVLFEFQSLVCDITEMELANASLYDGATSIAEAISVAINKTKRDNIIISQGFNPNSKEVINTLIDGDKFNIKYIELDNYLFPEDYEFNEDDAAFVVSFPHYEGSAQDLTELVNKAHAKGLIAICYVDPSMLGVLKTPGSMGFDIVVAEGQSIGTPLSFGGPTVGWFATKKDLARLVPGRIIGETIDSNHKKTYVMTLRAREQDIRREKASSNICTNQTLNAIGSAIHLSWMGPEGIYQVGYQAIQKAAYMKSELKNSGFKIKNESTSLREFLIETKIPTSEVLTKMGQKGFLAGISYSDNELLIALTEKRTKKEIDNYIDCFKEVNNG